MKIGKQVLRTLLVRRMICWTLSTYIKFLKCTGKWSVERGDIPTNLLCNKQPFIVAFWHGRLFMSATAWHFERPFNMVISEHPDGQLISGTVKHLGISTISGSTTRGGSKVLRQLLRSLKKGECTGITPDGPRGPRMRAKKGVVEAAKISGVPIVPLTYSATPSWLFSSWDRLMIPFPFATGIVKWGDPVYVPPDSDATDIKNFTNTIEIGLNQITMELDNRLGVRGPKPAESELK